MVLKKYDMGLISVTAMGIGSVVGAGIFALLGEVILQGGQPELLLLYHCRASRRCFPVIPTRNFPENIRIPAV